MIFVCRKLPVPQYDISLQFNIKMGAESIIYFQSTNLRINYFVFTHFFTLVSKLSRSAQDFT